MCKSVDDLFEKMQQSQESPLVIAAEYMENKSDSKEEVDKDDKGN